jgi:ribosomal protein S16
LKMDRIEHWISKGAQPSDTVRSLIKKNRNQASAPAEETAPAAAPAEETAGTPAAE